jgi:hypothetical protein
MEQQMEGKTEGMRVLLAASCAEVTVNSDVHSRAPI